MTYGVVSTGFSRKPLAEILAEIEASLITEFGPEVIQTPQSPLGQINGLMANLVAELWEFAEDIYQSYDPDQAEGVRLESLGRLRLLQRVVGETDESFRQAITNTGRARVDLQDLSRAIAAIEGVTYSHVFVNETGQLDTLNILAGTIVVAVIGGDDETIASVMRQYVVPGISTWGNTIVSTEIDGYCRSMTILRPIAVPIELTVNVRTFTDRLGCPPPSATAIKEAIISDFEFLNGDDVTFYRIRQILESAFDTVEVLSIAAIRDDGESDSEAEIGFIEIATLAIGDITVNVS